MVINNPSTVFVQFTGTPLPKYFCLFDDKGRIYYFRHLDGKTPRIKFNIPDPGSYDGHISFDVIKTIPIETPAKYPALPPAERDRWKKLTFVYNPELAGTPCRIFTDTGIIEYGDDYKKLPPPIKLFLNLHEIGHFLYTTESYCDLYALISFLRMGYNRSTAYYALSKILSRSPENMQRINDLFSSITVNGDHFKPF